jgi:hypothetical protein
MTTNYFYRLPQDIIQHHLSPFLHPSDISCFKQVSKITSTLNINWNKYFKNINWIPNEDDQKDSTIYYNSIIPLSLPMSFCKVIIHMNSIDILSKMITRLYTIDSKSFTYRSRCQRDVEMLINRWIKDTVNQNWYVGIQIIIKLVKHVKYLPPIVYQTLYIILRQKNGEMLEFLYQNRNYRMTIFEFSILKTKDNKNYIDHKLRDVLFIKLKDKIYTNGNNVYYSKNVRDQRRRDNNKYMKCYNQHSRTWDVILRDKDYTTAKYFKEMEIDLPRKKSGEVKEKFAKDKDLMKLFGREVKTIREIYLERLCKKCCFIAKLAYFNLSIEEISSKHTCNRCRGKLSHLLKFNKT